MKSLLPLICLSFIIWGVWSCSPEEPLLTEIEEVITVHYPVGLDTMEGVLLLPAIPFTYANENLPSFMTEERLLSGFAQMSISGRDNTPPENPITDLGATLGRVLFYDKKLSANGTIACASCHIQAQGFADPAPFSVGFEGEMTRRHSMTLINSRYYGRGRFFWDERAASLEEQVLQPFVDEIEMGLTKDSLVEIVSQLSYYPILFEEAFGDSRIDTTRIARALSQFVRSIVSYRTKYDEGRAQVNSVFEDFPNFNASENEGKQLFFATPFDGGVACFGCHESEGFVGSLADPQNNGLDIESSSDLGAFEAFPTRPSLRGAFKIPTLRNIAMTAPYMHDGRFQTLAEVINHYDQGIQNHAQLSPFLKDSQGQALRMNLSEQEKRALVDFLRTLTDYELNQDMRFSNPFIE